MQTTAVGAAIGAATGATQTSSNNLGTKDVFLKLLVAQMQYQDPLKPQDPTQMTAQLARFNMVEQQISTNKLLTDISANNASTDMQAAATAASYLGHQAVINGNQLQYDGATPENIVIQAPQGAANATAQVLDANGQVVKTLYTGPLNNGATPLTWDGSQDNGSPAAAGNYSIAVNATDANGTAVAASTQVIAQVQAVRVTTAGVQLVVGGVPVSMADVQEIRL